MNTGDTVDSFIGEVKQAIDCNEARDIVLWKTEMPNEPENAFTDLILAEGDNLTKLTAGELNRFWGEDLGRPLEDHIHIIIDSPYLSLKQEKDEELRDKDRQIQDRDDELDEMIDQLTRLRVGRQSSNILKRVYGKEVHVDDEVKYEDDHIGFLSARGEVPYIPYNGIEYESINACLKAYLLAKDPERDPEKNPFEDERRPFSIGGLPYDVLKKK